MIMEMSDVLRELQNHQGKWMAVINKKLVISENRQELAGKLKGDLEPFQIPRMYQGYQTWRIQMEDTVKKFVNYDAIKQNEIPPYMEVSEDIVKMELETEPLETRETRPKKSIFKRILGI